MIAWQGLKQASASVGTQTPRTIMHHDERALHMSYGSVDGYFPVVEDYKSLVPQPCASHVRAILRSLPPGPIDPWLKTTSLRLLQT